MKENLLKIKTYLGFAEKSGTLVIGTDNLLKSKKLKLIIFSDNLGESAQKKLINYGNSKNIVYYKLSIDELHEIYSKIELKAVGITEENLAKAIEALLFDKN